ncbi:FtsX-like permease family protein [Streptomyces pseudovenezuelae]|uniref:FtsX-like permease family protein n=2 Tax=Streptomyces TaxID=1883 RepID=UPI00099F02C8|nr:FtsX-like permease family protein [Streptomyces pseudovenezuelae]
MTGFGGIARLGFLRARAHRLLLAAALLTVLLTTAVLATLTAYSGAIGDAALRHSLDDPHNAADTALFVKADVPADRRTAADATVRKVARQTFDGLPVTVRTFLRSGPYALPRSLQPESARSGDPDLTHFAALDRSRLRLVEGRAPRPAEGLVEVALPQAAARVLRLGPGARFTLTDRLRGPAVRVTVTGLYRPVRTDDSYWLLDDLHGRGINKLDFTTYGPLLADPAVLTDGTVSVGTSGWVASADFATVTTARSDTLRKSAEAGNAVLRKEAAFGGATTASTALPEVLDRTDRSLLVSRSTLLIVALQLVLLAGCTLLLVAGLLSSERTGESRLLLARGASRARIAGLAALEGTLLAVPALLCAPLLAGPLTRLLAGRGPLARIGLHLQVPSAGRPEVWLVAGSVAFGCALAVTLPALTSSFARGRARALPGAVRSGADLGLLAVAGVAYFQLSRQTSGAVSDDVSGTLGVDPLLVAAPALALLAGTVLTLRLLPPLARLAERRATGGRGLTAALAGWQIARRPMRGAAPVLLLVLAMALGMLAIGQGASWSRSQSDQADFRAGAPVRVLTPGEPGPGRTEQYAAVAGVRQIAPATRSELPLSGGRSATVLALDTTRASMLIRPDLHSGPFLQGLAPVGGIAGVKVPTGTAGLRLTATLRSGNRSTTGVAVTVVDGYGTPFRVPAGQLPGDGRAHTLDVHLSGGPLILTALELAVPVPADTSDRQRFTVSELAATGTDGAVRQLPLPTDWTAKSLSDGASSASDPEAGPSAPRLSPEPGLLRVDYRTGTARWDDTSGSGTLTVRLEAPQPVPARITAVATERFLTSAGAAVGDSLDVPLDGETVSVRIVRSIRELPTASDSGGALLLDLRTVNRRLQAQSGRGVEPTEWWLSTDPGASDKVAAALRARPDMDPAQVVVRDELAGQLRDDPFGAGPEAAFAAAAGVAAALAAVGFAVSAAGSLRERGAEFAVLRALGAPRRRLARAVAVEQGVLVVLALLVGALLGTALTRAVVPLIVLTGAAARPVPSVLVRLPLPQAAALLAAVALVPLLVTAALALRRADPARALREGGE